MCQQPLRTRRSLDPVGDVPIVQWEEATLEHVLPRNPSNEWESDLRADPDLREEIDRLGNLYILEEQPNRRAGMTCPRKIPGAGQVDRGRLDRLLKLAVVLRHGQQPKARNAEQHRRRSNVIPHLGPPVIKASDTLIVRSQACLQAQAERRVARPSPRFTTKSP